MEHAEVRTRSSVESLRPGLSDEVRASLEAVRAAHVAARLRARRQTIHARLWSVTVVGAVALTTFAFAPRMARWWHARSLPAMSAQASATRPRPTEPVMEDAHGTSANRPRPLDGLVSETSAVAGRAAGETPAVAGRAAGETSPVAARVKAGETPPVAARVKPLETVSPDEGCDMGLLRTAPWRLSPAACARRFEAEPSNAALALAVAQAEHAHARLDEAAQWAKRALALDPNAAEAYVIIARAAAENGRVDEARTAYQRYLEIAPRGWHKGEARAALRRASSTR
jgi:hypothetical protein